MVAAKTTSVDGRGRVLVPDRRLLPIILVMHFDFESPEGTALVWITFAVWALYGVVALYWTTEPIVQ